MAMALLGLGWHHGFENLLGLLHRVSGIEICEPFMRARGPLIVAGHVDDLGRISGWRDGLQHHRHAPRLDAVHKLPAAIDHLTGILSIARDEFDNRLIRAHDDGERALDGAGDLHLPLHLRLIAVDHYLERLAAADVLCLNRTAQRITPSIERGGRPWIPQMDDDVAASRQQAIAGLEPVEIELLGGLAEPHWPDLREIFGLALADHFEVERHDLLDVAGHQAGHTRTCEFTGAGLDLCLSQHSFLLGAQRILSSVIVTPGPSVSVKRSAVLLRETNPRPPMLFVLMGMGS